MRNVRKCWISSGSLTSHETEINFQIRQKVQLITSTGMIFTLTIRLKECVSEVVTVTNLLVASVLNTVRKRERRKRVHWYQCFGGAQRNSQYQRWRPGSSPRRWVWPFWRRLHSSKVSRPKSSSAICRYWRTEKLTEKPWLVWLASW